MGLWTKMSKNMRKYLIILCTVLLFGCSKDSAGNDDREKPVVTILAPLDNQVYPGSQLIHLTGSVTDNRYIREIHLEISNLNTGTEYLHVHIHPAAAAYTYDQSYMLDAGTSYKIRVIADDAAFNSSVKQVNITCN